jgi:hypothetical protein
VKAMRGKYRIREHKINPSIDSPRFTIEIDLAKSQNHQIQNNNELLTKLIGISDVVISLDSTLLNLPYKQRKLLIQKFLENIREMNLDYKCMKVTGRSSQSFISVLFGAKNTQEEEILVYIPNNIWTDNTIQKSLLYHGARYFVIKNASTASAVLEDMQKMQDDEKLEYFKLIIFNCMSVGSTGIFSKYLSLSELEDIVKT